MLKVAIVILNWNGINFLRQFLPGVVKHSRLPGVQVMVADNGSDDGSVEWVKENLPEVRLICLGVNNGFAKGYVLALQEVVSDYYVLLNSDAEVTKDWLNPLLEMMENDHSIGAVMPKIKASHNKSQFEYAGASGGYIDRFGYPFCRGRILSTIEEDTGQYDTPARVFWASGACLMLQAKAYRDAGGLDGDFFAHMEEIDLCWRLQRCGYKVMCNPKSVVYHVGGGTLPNNTPRKMYLNYRNNLYLLFKNLPPEKLLPTLLTRLFLDCLSAMAYLISFRISFFWAVMKSHVNFYLYLPVLLKKRRSTGLLADVPYPDKIYNKSILVSYFFRKKRYFSKLSCF